MWTARVEVGLAGRLGRCGTLVPPGEGLPDRRFDRGLVEPADDVEPGSAGAIGLLIEAADLIERVALDHRPRSETPGHRRGRRTSPRGTSASAICCGWLNETARLRSRLALSRGSSDSGNFGFRTTSATSSTICRPYSLSTSPPIVVRVAADGDRRATRPCVPPAPKSVRRCGSWCLRASDRRSGRRARPRSPVSNALPVRMLERDPHLRHRAPLHQRDLRGRCRG